MSVPRLRQAALAVAVLDDVDVSVQDDGVAGPTGWRLSWSDVELALGPWAGRPSHPVTRIRLGTLIRAVELYASGGAAALSRSVWVHVEPRGSALHPGDDWVIERVGSGPVEAGWGLGDDCRPLPPTPTIRGALGEAVTAGHLDWSLRRAEVDRLARLLIERLDRDVAEHREPVLRPMAGVDVATLLLSRRLRTWLATLDGTGLAALAVPTRSRGWVDLRRIDPAFVTAAWHATDTAYRGFATALLVTADDVISASGVSDVLGPALADPVVDRRSWRGRG